MDGGATMQVMYRDHMGSDLSVCNAARTSFGKQKETLDDKDINLINFLAREKHVLPFRHPHITVRCAAPVFLARQLGKHQVGLSWSEESRRYIDSPPEFFWPDKWRKRAENVKQGSSQEEVNIINVDGGNGTPQQFAEASLRQAVFAYTSMLDAGVAPELARMILPQNMIVNWVWTGSLLSFYHLYKLRSESHSQIEAQQFAQMLAGVIAPLYPHSWEALLKHE
ncbi:putative flavin-dependent thymidylate synthase [Xanthomonas phage DES1]|nr:putative flavin-dependent thymidylate synthase [Xanthomonas phage DES1]